MRYLFLRDSRYYFRRKIPKPLSCIIGKQILCFSLNTDSISRAQKLVLKHTVFADDLFAKAEKRKAGHMTNEEFQIVLAHYYEMVLNELRENFNSRYEDIKSQKAITEKHRKEAIKLACNEDSTDKFKSRLSFIDLTTLSQKQRERINQIEAQINKYKGISNEIAESSKQLRNASLIAKETSKLDTTLTRLNAQKEIAQSVIDFCQLHENMEFEDHEEKGIKIAQSLNFDCSQLPTQFYSQLSIAAKEASSHAFKELVLGEKQEIQSEYTPPNFNTQTTTHQSSVENHILSELFSLFCKEEKDSVRPATLKSKESNFIEFIDIVGEIRVNDLNHNLCRKYVDTLKHLPANYAKKFNASPLKAVEIAPSNAKKASQTTINDKIRVISYFFDWCIRHGYFETINNQNMLKGKAQKIKRGGNNKNTYQPYSNDDIRSLFGEFYIKNTDKKSFHFWLPLIGLYTGARISEIVMLRTSDIKKSPEGIHYFEFCAYYEGKTWNSHRTMPIHPDLIELGFLKLVESQKKANQNRILSSITIPRNPNKGRGNNASKWYNDTFLKRSQKANIVSPAEFGRKKTFHSFRGTVITNLRENKADMPRINTVIGHADFSMQGKYSDQYSVKFQFEEVVSKIKYSDIDLELLKSSRHAFTPK